MKEIHSFMTILLPSIVIIMSCTQYNRIYSEFLLGKECHENCSRETNDVLRLRCYTKEIEKNPVNPYLYFKRGETYRKIYKFTSAISDFLKVVELEPGNASAYYALASTASLAYRNEYAIYCLRKAFEAGFDNYQQLEKDPSLDNIRNTMAFNTLLKKWDYQLTSIK